MQIAFHYVQFAGVRFQDATDQVIRPVNFYRTEGKHFLLNSTIFFCMTATRCAHENSLFFVCVDEWRKNEERKKGLREMFINNGRLMRWVFAKYGVGRKVNPEIIFHLIETSDRRQ